MKPTTMTSTQIEAAWGELRGEAERVSIRTIELRIEMLRNGHTPPDEEALAYYEGLLQELRKRAASNGGA